MHVFMIAIICGFTSVAVQRLREPKAEHEDEVAKRARGESAEEGNFVGGYRSSKESQRGRVLINRSGRTASPATRNTSRATPHHLSIPSHRLLSNIRLPLCGLDRASHPSRISIHPQRSAMELQHCTQILHHPALRYLLCGLRRLC